MSVLTNLNSVMSNLNAARGLAAEARYRIQHKSLAASSALFTKTFHFLMDPKFPSPSAKDLKTIERRLEDLLRQDLKNAADGYYPRELLFRFPIRQYTAQFPELALDYPKALLRKLRNAYKEIPKKVDRSEYPAYYLRNFHWQTDGWFSRRSAKLYDVQVELLFGGTADIMRRMALPPLVDAVGEAKHPKILDVACGPGSFLRLLAKALPDAKLYGLDLSPFYIAEAESRMAETGHASLVTENAESMPFQDGTFDAISCVFLFHELPTEARRNVLKEILRVLKPGGTFVMTDSAQLSESPDIAYFLKWFPLFYHEPYFTSYLKEDMGALMTEAGFERVETRSHYVSKTVIGRKPEKR